MTNRKAEQQTERSFEEAQEFLRAEIVGAKFPVWHLIELVRIKKLITDEKLGQASAVVTSRDMAVLLLCTLAGNSNQSGHDAMSSVVDLRPDPRTLTTDEFNVSRLNQKWWTHPYADTVAGLIDAWRQDPMLGFWDMKITVIQEPFFYGKISWNVLPYERDAFLIYDQGTNRRNDKSASSHRRLSASYHGETLMMVADWLEGRDGQCICKESR